MFVTAQALLPVLMPAPLVKVVALPTIAHCSPAAEMRLYSHCATNQSEAAPTEVGSDMRGAPQQEVLAPQTPVEQTQAD